MATYGRRNTQHIYGAVSVPDGQLTYHFAETCNALTHQDFLTMLIRKFHRQKYFSSRTTPSTTESGDVLMVRSPSE